MEWDSKHKLYNKVPKHNYKMDTIKRYDGLVIEHLDYHDCIHKYDDIAKETNKTVILVMDPPFMNTSQTYYKTDYFNINDYFEVIHLLYTHKYIYFEDVRNDIIRLSNTLKKFINQDLQYWNLYKTENASFGIFEYLRYFCRTAIKYLMRSLFL